MTPQILALYGTGGWVLVAILLTALVRRQFEIKELKEES